MCGALLRAVILTERILRDKTKGSDMLMDKKVEAGFC